MLNYMLGLKANSRSATQLSIVGEESSGYGMLPQEIFTRLLCLERKRTERSGRRFVLMLLDPGRLLKGTNKEEVLAKLLYAVTQSIRDTDLKGWYKDGSVIGVIFTEVGSAEEKSVVHALSTKVTDALFGTLSIEQINEIRLSYHVFPEDWDDKGPDGPATSTLMWVLARETNRNRASLRLKRLMDIAGSLAALVLCLPVFLAIAIAIKLTSKGPVLFRQARLGQYGKKFTFLKFRSMHANSDPSIHEQYVKRFIAGSSDTRQVAGSQRKLYKLAADPRITRSDAFCEKRAWMNFLSSSMS